MIRIRRNDLVVHLFLLGCIGVLVAGLLFTINEVNKIKGQKNNFVKEIITQKEFSKNNSKPVSLQLETHLPISVKPILTGEFKKRVTYINLNGPFSTTQTDWQDVVSTDVLINLVADYGESAYVDWEASVDAKNNGNKVFIRLYDTTNKIAVNGSEIWSDTTLLTRISSSQLYLWRGSNNYRVQIKSLNGQEVDFSSARIKIVY